MFFEAAKMKQFCQITTIISFMAPAILYAYPIDSEVIYTDMPAERCFDTAKTALSDAKLVNIDVNGNVVQANDTKKRYFVSIRCENENEIIFFAVSGPDNQKRAELMRAVYQEDDDVIDNSDEDDCVLKSDSDDSAWRECDGEGVTILGQISQMVMQHPIIAYESGSLQGKSGPTRSIQNYMDVGDHQIILLSKTEINCTGEMQVTGTLGRIDMGGKAGTKQSYTGWSVQVDKFMCF